MHKAEHGDTKLRCTSKYMKFCLEWSFLKRSSIVSRGRCLKEGAQSIKNDLLCVWVAFKNGMDMSIDMVG